MSIDRWVHQFGTIATDRYARYVCRRFLVEEILGRSLGKRFSLVIARRAGSVGLRGVAWRGATRAGGYNIERELLRFGLLSIAPSPL